MRYTIIFLLFTTVAVAQNVTEEVYQYVVTPVTDSTWNLDVINVMTNPQQIKRYSNFTKGQIDNFFYKNLLENYNVMAINNYKYLIEDLKSQATKSTLTNNLQFDYDLASKNNFSNSYKGEYVFISTGNDPVVVKMDSTVHTITYSVDSVLQEYNEYVVNTTVNGLDTIQTVDTITTTGYEYTNTEKRTDLFTIIPKSEKYFVLNKDEVSIEMFSEDKISWIGKDYNTGNIYFFRKR